MIISYRHNFIFIRTRKTAGSTIEAVLRPLLGPEDIYSEGITIRGSGHSKDNSSGGVQHMKAAQMADLVPESFWNRCFKFTSERHPYEKAVSLAYFSWAKRLMKGKDIGPSFELFLDRIVRAGNYRSYEYYTMGEGVVVDEFVRQETLPDDLRRIGEKLGIEIPDELPHRKAQFRTDARPAHEILSEEQKHIVYQTTREEFDLLGYVP